MDRSLTLFQRLFLNEWVVLTAICLNSLLLFAMGFDSIGHRPGLVMIDLVFTLIFVIETVVKIRVWGRKAYFASEWNVMDFIIILFSAPSILELFFEVPDFSYVLLFRTLRVLRIFRFVRFIPDVKRLVLGIKRALKASIFVFSALFVYNFLLSVLTCYIFKELDPANFGNPFLSFYTIFTIFTVENWQEIPNHIAANSSTMMAFWVRAYFVGVVLTGGLFGFSIVNAIFVDEMVRDNTDELEVKIDSLIKKVDALTEGKETE